jgi:hypothetical protein
VFYLAVIPADYRRLGDAREKFVKEGENTLTYCEKPRAKSAILALQAMEE